MDIRLFYDAVSNARALCVCVLEATDKSVLQALFGCARIIHSPTLVNFACSWCISGNRVRLSLVLDHVTDKPSSVVLKHSL